MTLLLPPQQPVANLHFTPNFSPALFQNVEFNGTGYPHLGHTGLLPSQDYASSNRPQSGLTNLEGLQQVMASPARTTQGQEQMPYLPSVPLQPRRQISEVNHNKAITKQLVSATHYQQVLDCVAQSVQLFDEVNVATALHRMARLQPPTATSQGNVIVQSREFQMLVRAIEVHLPRFEAQAISNSMWAFATLSYMPQNKLLEEIANKAVSIMPSFRPQAVSNTLWAFAKLGFLPPPKLLQAVANQMHQDLPKSVPQDISNTLWAFATLRHSPGLELLNASSQQALSMFHKFKPQEIANLLWSFATLDYNPPSALLDAMAVQMVARIQSFRPQAVSNSLWAYAKINYNPGTMLLDVAGMKAATMFHQYSSQEVANTLWAVAALDHFPGPEMLNAAATQFAKRLEHFTPQDIASTLWAFAKLYHTACRGLLPNVALHVLKLWARFTPTAIVTILESLAILQGCSLHIWTQLLAKLYSLPVASLTAENLWHLYHTFLILEASARGLGIVSFRVYFSVEMLQAAHLAWLNTAQKRGWLDPVHQDVSQHLSALGIAHSNDELIGSMQLHVDVLVRGSNIVVEILDGSDFTSACRSTLGTCIAKSLILEGQGYRVISIPFYDWSQLATPERKASYLLQRLHGAPAPNLPVFQQAQEQLPQLGGTYTGLQTPSSLSSLSQPIYSGVSQGNLSGLLQASQEFGTPNEHLSFAQLSHAISNMPLQIGSNTQYQPSIQYQSRHQVQPQETGRMFSSTQDSVASTIQSHNLGSGQSLEASNVINHMSQSPVQSASDIASQFQNLKFQ